MRVKFTLLGTGSSMGVPRPDGFLVNVILIIKKTIEQDVQL